MDQATPLPHHSPAGGAPPPGPDTTSTNDPRQAQAQEVLARLEDLARGLERMRATIARAAGLRVPAYALLEVVGRASADGITVSEAALRLGVRPQALSPLVAELSRDGLLKRQIDPTDARARRLYITTAGHQRLARGEELRHQILAAILSQVPAPNVALLVLGKLETALQAADRRGCSGACEPCQ